jgi:antitoxin VapB
MALMRSLKGSIYVTYLRRPRARDGEGEIVYDRGDQAVRLPAEFRFEGSEVEIRRDPITKEVVLSQSKRSWDDYFDWVRTLDLPDDFLENRDQPREDLRDRQPTPRLRRG